MGPIMLDLAGLELSNEDRDILKHPLVGGVVLFARNFINISQLKELIRDIRASSNERLLVAVDHEGGRIQRFREGFTIIPPAQSFAVLLEEAEAKHAAAMAGWLIATELISLDIDISFTPVLDLGHACPAIGDRAFHGDANIVFVVANAMIDGLHDGGMKVTGKHFPGHGAVNTDSHQSIAVDTRSRTAIADDMAIFNRFIQLHKLDAIMPAHVIYPAFDAFPASGSSFWLNTMLKNQLRFSGVIISDDLSMEGAKFFGSYAERTLASLSAGCDMVLICNNRTEVVNVIDTLPHVKIDKPKSLFYTQTNIDYTNLVNIPRWQQCHDKMQYLNDKWQTQRLYLH